MRRTRRSRRPSTSVPGAPPDHPYASVKVNGCPEGTGEGALCVFESVSVLLFELTQLEQVTEGWFIDTYMFNALWLGIDGFWVDLFSFFVMELLVFFIGASVATIYMRWRMPGMLVFWSSLALAIVGTVSIITFTSSWPPVAVWFGTQGIAGIFAWLLVPAALAGFGGFLALRRATPKN